MEVSRGPSFCYQDPGIWTSTSNRFSSNSFIQGSFDKQPVFFPREECSSLRSCCGYAAQRSNPGQGFFISGFLQQTFPCGKEDWRMEASNRFESFKSLSGLPHFQDGNYSVHQKLPSSWPVDNFSGPQGRILPHSHGSFGSHKLLRFQVLGKLYQFVAMPFGLATAPREFTTLVKEVKRMALRLGISVHMYLDDWLIKANSCQEAHSATLTLLELTHKLGWIVNREKSDLLTKQVFTFLGQVFVQGGLLSYRGQVPVHSGGYSSSAFQPPYYSTPGYAPFGSTSLYREVSTSGSPSYATPSISSQEELQLPPERCPGFSILLGPFSEGSSKVVVTEEQCHWRKLQCTHPNM